MTDIMSIAIVGKELNTKICGASAKKKAQETGVSFRDLRVVIHTETAC